MKYELIEPKQKRRVERKALAVVRKTRGKSQERQEEAGRDGEGRCEVFNMGRGAGCSSCGGGDELGSNQLQGYLSSSNGTGTGTNKDDPPKADKGENERRAAWVSGPSPGPVTA